MKNNIPILMKDTNFISKYRTVIAEDKIQIPGIEMIGKHIIKSALPPLELHYHPYCFEFTFVLEGSIVFGVEETDVATGERKQKEYHLNGGDVFVTFPNEVHGSNMMPVQRSELIWFQIDILKSKDFLFLESDVALKLILRMKNLKGHIYRMNSLMSVLIQNAFQSILLCRAQNLSAAYFVLILNLIVEELPLKDKIISNDIQESVDYIRKNLTQTLSIEELANLSGHSVSTYKHKFKIQMGITPRNYINMLKIEYAKQLLKTGKSVTEVAMILGFNTSSYFTTVFKKYTSQSPVAYIGQRESNSCLKAIQNLTETKNKFENFEPNKE